MHNRYISTAFTTTVILLVALCGSSVLANLDSAEGRLPQLLEIETFCDEVNDPPFIISNSCTDRIADHFGSLPIWDQAVISYDMGSRLRTHGSTLSHRALYLHYSTADLEIESFPVWSDIFDDRVDERFQIVSNAFRDVTCSALVDDGPIQANLKNRCHASELYRYAAFIDACMTGFDRHGFLNDRVMAGQLSRFDTLKKDSDRLQIVHPNSSEAELTEANLLATWMIESCRSMAMIFFDENLEPQMLGEGRKERREVIEALQIGHDAAMSIAARAGDPWAIQSFYVSGLIGNMEYWKSLYDINPLLFHRWMGTAISASLLGDREAQLKHVLKAYSMERVKRPGLDLSEYVAGYRFPSDILDSTITSEEFPSLDRSKRETIVSDKLKGEFALRYPWESDR